MGTKPEKHAGIDSKSGVSGEQRHFCHICYDRGHVAPSCTLSLREQRRVIANFEALTDTEKQRVPADSYEHVKLLFKDEGAQGSTESKN